MATVELRLVDPDGYTVIHSGAIAVVPDDQAAATEARMLAEIAPQDAAAWADFGYRAADYRVRVTDPAEAAARPLLPPARPARAA